MSVYRTPPPAADGLPVPPSLYRSEAFAEDLLEFVAPLPQWQPEWRHEPAAGRIYGVIDGLALALSSSSSNESGAAPRAGHGGGLGRGWLGRLGGQGA